MAVLSKLPALFLGLLLGGGMGVMGTLRYLERPEMPEHEVRLAPPSFDEMPEQMLFPAGFTLDQNVGDPVVLRAMLDPDAIEIHAADNAGSLVVGDWKFSADGVTPDGETTARLKRALGSVSSYEPPGKLCAFHPDVLLRLEKDGHAHDIVFCFTCSQTTAGLDLSHQGKRVFLKCFCDALPGFVRLHEARARFEGTN